MVNWDAIGAIGEIVGATAVVATLLYLARETRNNTQAVVAASTRTSSWGFAEFNTQIASDEVLSRLIHKSMQDPMPEFDDLEWVRFQLLARSEVGRVQDAFLQSSMGFQNKDLAETQLNFMRSLLELPAWRAFWDDETSGGTWTQAFVDDVNSREPMHIGMSQL